MPFHKISGPCYAWYGSSDPTDPDYGVGLPERPDNSLPWGPGRPGNSLPPLPGIWPPPGRPNLPIELPPVEVAPPIYIEQPPDKPLPPPGIYPPLPPDAGLPNGKIAILIWVVGVGYRWLVYDKVSISGPPTPEPKTK